MSNVNVIINGHMTMLIHINF